MVVFKYIEDKDVFQKFYSKVSHCDLRSMVGNV